MSNDKRNRNDEARKSERPSFASFELRHFRSHPLRCHRLDILSIAARWKIDDMPQPTSFSFSKARRLTRASEYERVKRDGLIRRGKLLMLSVAAVENSGPSRAGFITSRRIGDAVARNRVRRRLREIVRQHQHDLRQDFWIVLIARRDAAKASYRSLEDEWLRLARRASILL
jgi:ribonuclease P protein component